MANAMRVQGSRALVGTTKGPNVGVTGVTKANPGVFTSATHSLAVGDIVEVSTIVGMPEFIPGFYEVNTIPTATTFTLKNKGSTPLDTTAYATVGTTANVNKWTMTTVCEINSLDLQNPAVPEIETTGFCDDAETYVPGLKQSGTASMAGNFLAQDTTQVALRDYESAGTTFPLKIAFPTPATNGNYLCGVFVQNMNFSGQKGGKWELSASFKKATAEKFYI